MKDLFISCVHLGNPLFKSKHFIGELLSRDYRKILLLGDIWDTWEMPFENILKKYQYITEIIREQSEKKEIIFTWGNHDPTLPEIQNAFQDMHVCTVFAWSDLEGVCRVLHGHQFDNAIVKKEWLSKLLYYFLVSPVYHVFRYNLRDKFKNLLHSIAARRGKKSYNSIVMDVERQAVAKYGRVIMGHTHTYKIVQEEETLYINPGDWIHNHSYIEYDIETGKYSLHEEE